MGCLSSCMGRSNSGAFTFTKSVPHNETRFPTCHHFKVQAWETNFLFVLRERPFHYLGGGLEELFSADYFFTWCLKLDFFFTHQLKPDFFFTKNWKSDYFFIVMFQVKDIHIIFRVEARLFFLQHIKAKKFFQRTGWAKLFFLAKSSTRLFFQKLFQPPPPR